MRTESSAMETSQETQAVATLPETFVIESRFGMLTIPPQASLLFPQGLLGFGDCRDFALADLPDGKQPQFKALQCLTDPSLAFLVAPLPIDNGVIDSVDMEEACASLSIAADDLAVVLIVTVRRDDAGVHVSVNLRAPILIDVRRRVARQYVLPNNKYEIRHKL